MARNQRDTKKEKPKDTKGTLLRMLRYVSRYRYLLILTLSLCFISNLLALWGPSLAGSAIAEAEAGPGNVNFDNVFFYAKRMLIVYLTSSLLTLGINFLMMNIGRMIARQMRNDVFFKLMTLPVGFFDRNAAGDIISRVSYDIDILSTCICTDIVQIMTSLVTVIGSLIMMLYICPPLVLAVAVTIPMAIGYTRYMGKKTRPLFSRRSAAYGKMNGYVEEMFSGQKTILAYAQEDRTLAKFDQINLEASEAFYWSNHYGMTIGPTVGSINNLGLALVGMFGAVLYLKDIVTLKHISSFILYSRKFSGPINEISNIINEIYSALAAAERVFKLLDEPEEVHDIENAVELTDVKGDVELKDVSFGYVPGKTIIHDFSLKAEPGSQIAIVGPTGAGKTTVINLLMRFYDPQKGIITIDGQDITQVTRQSLRLAYSMVLQDTWLFQGSIYDNIAYGAENVTMEQVVAAAKAAKIHNFIMSLPDGYQTILTDNGSGISKGQKQLLTIARAMLLNAPMLILDEATSNVDTQTEQTIQAAMRTLMAGKTCFVIAHRLSTIRHADHILVMQNGQVVEQGTHESLMAQNGFYSKLYHAQFDTYA